MIADLWLDWNNEALAEWNTVTATSWRLALPWPPSVNHYWQHGLRGVWLSKRARVYRQNVQMLALMQRGWHGLPGPWPLRGELEVKIFARPPDRHKRDLDNLAKALLDSLCHAGVMEDDSQISSYAIRRLEPGKPGMIALEITSWQ